MPENRLKKKASWQYNQLAFSATADTGNIKPTDFLSRTDCLVEMRRIELLSEGIVSPISPSAATDYF